MTKAATRWALRVTLGVALVSGAGCRCGPVVTSVEGELVVEPEGLAFGDAWVGFPSERTLTLTSRTRAPIEVTLEASPAVFSVEPGTVTVGGGASVDVVVRYAPVEPGDAVGLVMVGDRSVPLSGRGVSPPDCRGGRQCVTSTFSPDAGACVDVPVPAGTPCASSNVCLTATECVGGTCVGRPVPCDDADACTLDVCDGSGCVHRVLDCPPPADPCRVAACDPVTGCGARDAPDGTACGPNDCATAHVCVSGRCVTAAAPNGSECQPATRCQGAGRCQDGTCARMNPNALSPTWTYAPPAGWAVDPWVGLQMDVFGNVYFRECQGSCPLAPVQRVVSLSPGGVLRFTTPLGANSVRDTFALRASQVIADGLLITFSADGLAAVSTVTGAVAWQTPLPPFTPDAAPEPLVGQWLVAPAPGVVAVGYTMNGAGVLGVSTRTGRGEWVWRSSGAFLDEAIADEDGNLVFGTYGSFGTLVSLDLQGQQRWVVVGRADMLSAYDGTLAALGELRSMASGGPPVPFGQVGAPVSCSWASFIGHPQERGRLWGFTNGTCGTNSRAVFVVDLVRRVTRQLGSTSSFIRVPALSSRGTFIALENASSQQDQLVEYTAQGPSACALPNGNAIDALIDHERLVRLVPPSRVEGFELPGVQLAPAGWVTSRGDSTRRGRPR